MPSPLIVVRDLKVAYGAKVAVESVSFTVNAGEILGYLGPNGAGKSSTVKVLCGMNAPTAGSVTVCGFDVATQPLEVKRRLGYVPESGALYESLTVEEHLLLIGRLYRLGDAEILDRARRYAGFLGLEEKWTERVGSLSKGTRQKVLIAAALLHNPEVLFFDEPLSGLDVNAALLFRELVRSLADAGKAIFYSSHVLEVVESLCQRVIILDKGRIVADGPVAQLRERAHETSLNAVFQSLTSSQGPGDLASTARAFAAAVTAR